MKSTALKFPAMEAMPSNVMRFVLGGEACATPGDTVNRGGITIKYSADTRDGTSVTYNVTTDKSTASEQCPCTPTVPTTDTAVALPK